MIIFNNVNLIFNLIIKLFQFIIPILNLLIAIIIIIDLNILVHSIINIRFVNLSRFKLKYSNFLNSKFLNYKN